MLHYYSHLSDHHPDFFVWIVSAIKKIKNNDLLPTNISKYKALRNEKKSILLMLNIGIPAIAFVLIILFVENPVFLLFLLGFGSYFSGKSIFQNYDVEDPSPAYSV